MVQEGLLSSINPRPTGEKLKEDPLYPELVRRVSLVERNWAHQKKGMEDAAKNLFSFVELPGQSDVDQAYSLLLQAELGFSVVTIPEGLSPEEEVFYAFGFNSHQLERASQKFGTEKLRDLIYKSAISLGYKSTSSSSLLFVPWRFSVSVKPTIRGLKSIPHSR